MVRIAAISYLNTIPFIYGLEAGMAPGSFVLDRFTPAGIMDRIRDGACDLALVPVGALDELDHPQIVSDFCIGADGAVASVMLCSPCPVAEVEEIRLDIDSRTSVLLTRYLCAEKWHISPRFTACDFNAEPVDPQQCSLLIGDKALIHADRFNCVYDLAAEWKSLKRLPFVFACWVTFRQLEPAYLEAFNQALAYGVRHIPEAVRKFNHQFPGEYACKYLQENISYALDSEKRAGLTEFRRVALEKLTPRAC